MEPEIFRKKCKGIIPVQYCPYTENGELDLDGLRKNTGFLVDFAEDGDKDLVIMTNGSTTECYAMSTEEQKAVIKTVVDAVDGAVPVVAGTSLPGTRETIKLTGYAEKVGADCAMVVLPYYHTPTKEGMYRHFREIAEAVDLGVMIYNNPDVSGALLDPYLVQRLSKIENIVALKDNTPNTEEYLMKAALIDPEDMALINGAGELHYLGSAAYGLRYRGFVTWIGNFAPSLSYAIYEATERRDFAGAYEALKSQLPLWNIIGKFMERRETPSIIPSILRTNYLYMSVGKACMDLTGLNGGPLRSPMEELTEEEKGELGELLKNRYNLEIVG